MNPSTLVELQRELQKINASESQPRPFFRRPAFAWGYLVFAFALAAFWFSYESESSRFTIPLLSILIAGRALYILVQNNIDKRLRPILEGLLSVPEVLPKQEHSEVHEIVKPKRARPKRR